MESKALETAAEPEAVANASGVGSDQHGVRSRSHESRHQLGVALESDWETAYSNIQAVSPGHASVKNSPPTAEGMGEDFNFLAVRLAALRPTAAV